MLFCMCWHHVDNRISLKEHALTHGDHQRTTKDKEDAESGNLLFILHDTNWYLYQTELGVRSTREKTAGVDIDGANIHTGQTRTKCLLCQFLKLPERVNC